MPQKKFSAAWVDKVKTDKRTDYYDTETSGLGLRVSPSGTKTFFYRYRFGSRNRRYTIDRYSKKSFTLSDARAEADMLRSGVRKGADPAGEDQASKQKPENITFQDLHKLYENIHLPDLRKSTREYHNWIVDSKIMPVFGKLQMNEISQQHIIRLLDYIAIEGGAKATANKARSRLHHIFEFAIKRGYAKANPVSGTDLYQGGVNQSERFYEADEIKEIWEVIETLNEPVRSYMKIIVLTGQRRSETLSMQWENVQYVDDDGFEGYVWMIPKELAKSKREHLVPLSPLAYQTIQELKQGRNPYVFASIAKDDIPIGLKTVKRAVKTIKDDSGVSDFRLHDSRRTVATWLAKLGTPAEVVSKVLNHKTGGGGSLVTRIYNRYEYRAERQRALNLWAVKLHHITTGEKAVIHELKKTAR